MALLLAALTMGLLFAHVLELGPKFGYPPELYVRLNNSLSYWRWRISAGGGACIWLSCGVVAGRWSAPCSSPRRW